ncbi:RNA-binding S4 domain-containing protein [Thorsellia kenyensis]|uniref:Heat shock protein 15 n=1 Tax=Thorsellia kenyensis TaxID=1549888 RepID=A0ABV6CAY5_9GAMM
MSVRLDKWLFAARFYKSRSTAREMIDGGKVHVNNQRAKPSKNIDIGDNITLRQGIDVKEVIVKELSEIRGSATIASSLYVETPESITKREKLALARKLAPSPLSKVKPSKKERREIIKFKNIYDNQN